MRRPRTPNLQFGVLCSPPPELIPSVMAMTTVAPTRAAPVRGNWNAKASSAVDAACKLSLARAGELACPASAGDGHQ